VKSLQLDIEHLKVDVSFQQKRCDILAEEKSDISSQLKESQEIRNNLEQQLLELRKTARHYAVDSHFVGAANAGVAGQKNAVFGGEEGGIVGGGNGGNVAGNMGTEGGNNNMMGNFEGGHHGPVPPRGGPGEGGRGGQSGGAKGGRKLVDGSDGGENSKNDNGLGLSGLAEETANNSSAAHNAHNIGNNLNANDQQPQQLSSLTSRSAISVTHSSVEASNANSGSAIPGVVGPDSSTRADASSALSSSLLCIDALRNEVKTKDLALWLAHFEHRKERQRRGAAEGRSAKLGDRLQKLMFICERNRKEVLELRGRLGM
jgi:hypothetical protein